jgi:hypothetical protein
LNISHYQPELEFHRTKFSGFNELTEQSVFVSHAGAKTSKTVLNKITKQVKTTKFTKKVHSLTVKLGQHSKTTKSSSKSGSNKNGVKGQSIKTKVSFAQEIIRPS